MNERLNVKIKTVIRIKISAWISLFGNGTQATKKVFKIPEQFCENDRKKLDRESFSKIIKYVAILTNTFFLCCNKVPS